MTSLVTWFTFSNDFFAMLHVSFTHINMASDGDVNFSIRTAESSLNSDLSELFSNL